MPHEIERILEAASHSVWLIDEAKAHQILAFLSLRAGGPAAVSAELEAAPQEMQVFEASGVSAPSGVASGRVYVIPVHGTIFPRANMMSAFSGGVSLSQFQQQFRQAAEDTDARAIVLDIDSPGGVVDLVQETAAMIRGARRAGRPIIAVANTLAASAAYWLASAADEIVISPSGMVGSIGVFTHHDDLSARAERDGIRRTYVYEGPRKVERNPFAPLGDEARAALQSSVRATYEAFTKDVAAGRGVPVSVVRADPEQADRHFGGGRAYHAREAVRLGMADRIESFDQVLTRLTKGQPARRARRADMARRRLALI